MTKIITATSVMQVVDKGLIGLDDDVRPLVSELAGAQILRGFNERDQPILEPNSDAITLRQLLCHASGMGYDALDPDLSKWAKVTGRTATSIDQTREGWNTPLKFRPGESWLYGSGIDWAGQVLEEVTGQSLGAYMSENVFKPLGMKDTTFRRGLIADELAGRLIELTYRNSDGSLVSGPMVAPENPPLDSGGAGLFSTAQDYIKILQAILAAGEGKGTLLSREAVDEMFRPQLNDARTQTLRASVPEVVTFLGGVPLEHGINGVINMVDVKGKRGKGSMSWSGMSNSQWWIDRDAGVAAVLFVNVIPQPPAQGDKTVLELYDELERAVYDALG
ncbi:hypothetical protein ACJ41O_015043 [Fusarium nematophilum]